MHTLAPQKFKSSILSLLTGIYSRQALKDFGFQFSHTQYTTANKKKKNADFSLIDYQRSIPSPKVSNIIIKYSFRDL